MTSLSPHQSIVNIYFFRDAAAVYGAEGLCPSTAASVGSDLRACLTEGDSLLIPAGERRAVPTGIAVEALAQGIAGFVYSRSGLGAVKGLTVAQGIGLIDPDYRGEITVFLLNTGKEDYSVQKGDRIAQLVFQPFIRPLFTAVPALGVTERGAGGFGHTGTR